LRVVDDLAGENDSPCFAHGGHRWLKGGMSKNELQKIQEFYRQRYGEQNEPK
jgi:hypothetical protein